MKKGQAIITDLLVAISVFIVLVISINIAWDYYSLKINDDAVYSDMFIRASQISETLVTSKGYPINWNSTNVEIIGLALTDRNLSESQIGNFTALSTSTVKDLLKIALYNFTFQLTYLNSTPIALYGDSGNATISTNSRRVVLYKNESAILNFNIWK